MRPLDRRLGNWLRFIHPCRAEMIRKDSHRLQHPPHHQPARRGKRQYENAVGQSERKRDVASFGCEVPRIEPGKNRACRSARISKNARYGCDVPSGIEIDASVKKTLLEFGADRVAVRIRCRNDAVFGVGHDRLDGPQTAMAGLGPFNRVEYLPIVLPQDGRPDG